MFFNNVFKLLFNLVNSSLEYEDFDLVNVAFSVLYSVFIILIFSFNTSICCVTLSATLLNFVSK